MKYNILVLFFAISVLAACTTTRLRQQNATEFTTDVLTKQVVSWNRGDLQGYMEGYWKSDSVQFVGKNGITYGWNNVLQNYQRSYPDQASMGKLNMNVISLKPLNADMAYVTGRWELQRAAGDLSGYFTLIIRRINGEWRIISDHSS